VLAKDILLLVEKSPHYWVGQTSSPGGRLAGTGSKAGPACYVSGSGEENVLLN